MQLKNKVELEKCLDEHECNLICSNTAPIDYILHCLEDFKTYVLKIKEEQEKKSETSASES